MGLLDYLEDSELEKKPKLKEQVIINLMKRMFFDLDVFSSSLVYIWKDENRIKFNMDGATEVFGIKHGTKFSNMIYKNGVDDPEFFNHLENQIREYLTRYDIEIYSFYFNNRKIIFKIKAINKINTEKCLY